jgi:hypothetical protein
MWPPSALWVPDAVSVDYAMIAIFQEREVAARYASSAFRQVLQQFSGVLMRIDADCEHLCLYLFTQKFFQLDELGDTVRSPMAAIEDQHHRSMPAECR